MNIKTLESIQDRILWLSIQLVNHANTVRKNRSDLKVGGHQTSSSSVVTILTYLYFEYLEKYDYVSIKPHASPVFHAIQYLLGNLDKKYLTSLRELHGLQSYPSRTKDPDIVDFSGGSVGIGSIAPNFAAISHQYLKDHSLLNKDLNNARFISLLGDAELDEGTIWEAIADPTMEDISNVIWIVDLNRQSLDRIIPFIRVKTWRQMFKANGWNVIDAKYGKKLEDVFNLPNGELMKNAIDDAGLEEKEVSNEMTGLIVGSGGPSTRNFLDAFEITKSKGAKKIGPFISDCLITGFHRENKAVVLAIPDKKILNGSLLG